MIKIWIIICDECGKEVDGTKEFFHQHENYGDLCEKCYQNI